MNYEKKYKEALERARQFSEHPLQEDSATIVEYIFPELAESEDERIKRTILELVSIAGNGNQFEEIKDWLEKQGEQPTDKVDTKFNVGDWISGYYTNYKVMAINSKGYVVEDTDGNKINILFENEKFHHLFTITDAKDGDVLVSSQGRPFIFSGKYDDINSGEPIAYCGVNCQNKFKIGKGTHWTDKNEVAPATKEQCDQLFAKMRESGYEWDAEKKELKKIEPKKLDADKVIAWLVANICDFEYYVKQFKQDFKL